VLLQDKAGTSITSDLKSLFQNRKPFTTQYDKGTEFLNVTVQQYLERQGVNFHTYHNPDINGAVIERFNKSLKSRMFKYFTKNNTYRYMDRLDKLLRDYNTSIHSTKGMALIEVSPYNIYSV